MKEDKSNDGVYGSNVVKYDVVMMDRVNRQYLMSLLVKNSKVVYRRILNDRDVMNDS